MLRKLVRFVVCYRWFLRNLRKVNTLLLSEGGERSFDWLVVNAREVNKVVDAAHLERE